jgi:hypothetical protein
MHEEPTTIIIQRYLDALPGGTAAEPVVRELLERAAGRLRLLCGTFLDKSYPRLTRPPVNLETDESRRCLTRARRRMRCAATAPSRWRKSGSAGRNS